MPVTSREYHDAITDIMQYTMKLKEERHEYHQALKEIDYLLSVDRAPEDDVFEDIYEVLDNVLNYNTRGFSTEKEQTHA